MITRAPGKLVLSGAYAVLEGAPALVAAVDRYAEADAVRAPMLVTGEVAAAIERGALREAPWFDASALRSIQGGASHKLGLGSSAAILVASLGAASAREGLDDGALRQLVFEPALAAHRAAQGGGSGIDVAASTFGGVICARRADGGLLHVAHALPSDLVITVFWSGVAASTPSLVGAVRALASNDPRAHATLLGALASAAEAARSAAHPEAFIAALRAQFEGLHALGEAAGAPIVPDAMHRLAEFAGEEGAAFGPSGAGGGDVALHVATRQPSARFQVAAAAAGIDRLDVTLGARGLHLAPLTPGAKRAAASIFSPRSPRNVRRSASGYIERSEGEVRMADSVPPTFRELPLAERRREIAARLGLDVGELERALETGGLDVATADRMVENAIGTLALPFGVALYVTVNGVEYMVPMATEEPSVIAAASHAAKRIRAGGGFRASHDEPLMIAQIEVHAVADSAAAVARILDAKSELLGAADRALPGLVERGGGARDVEVRDLGEGYVVTHVIVDCRDAMGANLLNTVAETLGPRVAELAAGKLGLRILTNYCDRRLTRVSAAVPVDALGSARTPGIEAARGIASASRFAELDPYRAVTHNKGVMNGVDAVVLATGNDFRAVEAAAHAFAARGGRYAPLATWRLSEDEEVLHGAVELPLALGIVGGALRAHRGASLAIKLLAVSSAAQLAEVAAAVGLATNLAALRALATEGIQRGHMALHHRASGATLSARTR